MWYFRVQKDELCNEVLNMNAKHECLIPLHKESWVKNEQRVHSGRIDKRWVDKTVPLCLEGCPMDMF